MRRLLHEQLNMVQRLKGAIVLFALVLMPMGAWAQDEDYSKTICVDSKDETIWITSNNADDILGDGTMIYNADNNVLTLDNVDLSCTATGAVFISCVDWNQALNTLTIRLVGSNTITLGNDAGFFYGSALTFITDDNYPGSLTINKESGWSGILFKNSDSGDATITPTYSNHLYLDHDGESECLIQWLVCPRPYSYNDGNNIVFRFGSETGYDDEVIHYSIDYVDENLLDVTDVVYDVNGDDQPLLGPCTMTYYITAGGGQSETKTAKLFGLATNSATTPLGIPVAPPTIVPAFDHSEDLIITETQASATGVAPVYDGTTGLISTSAVGETTCSVKLSYYSASWYDYFVLNDMDDNEKYIFGNFTLTVNEPENYNLRIYDTEVTSANASNITGDGISGTVTFAVTSDPTNKEEIYTLTLENATIDQYQSVDAIAFDYPKLTVRLIGENHIQNGFAYPGTHTDPAIVEFISDGGEENCLIFDNAYESSDLDYGPNSIYTTGFSNCTYNEISDATGWTLGQDADGHIKLYRKATAPYGLSVCGIAVTNENADNILNDTEKTVRFDSETNTLTLRNASLSASGTIIPVESGIGNFSVKLVGSNTINGNADYPVFYNTVGGLAAAPTLTFTTDGTHPGKLKWSGASLSSFSVVYDNDLGLWDGNLISVSPEGYGLTVGDVEVTNVNADDVLGDGTVSFEEAYNPNTQQFTGTLSLNGATIDGSVILSADSDISELTVMLKGASTITGSFQSEKAASTPKLFFATDPNSPGSLTFTDKTDGTQIQGGFMFLSDFLLNELTMKAETAGWTISTFTLIDPIVDEDEPNKVVVIDNRDGSYDNLDGVVINDVYYTLGSGEGGYDNGGITIGYGMTDAEVEAAVNGKKPGDPGFSAFRGITLMVPAGIGTLTIRAKAENGGVLKVKVGSSPATDANVSGDEGDVVIGYNCAEPTYIYLYVLATSSVRGDSPHRGKVQTATVKVSSYSGRSQAVCTSAGGSNTATVYSCSSVGYSTGDTSVTMSSVSVPASSGSSTASPARGARQPADDMVEFTITALGENVFEEITDKDAICYIDLTRTGISDFVVNRDGGVLKGFGNRTLVCLPDGNDDGWEPNAVVGGVCSDLQLDQSFSFLAPKIAFTASKAELNRTFTAGQTSTIILPFDIPASEAALLGIFYRFKEISNNDAVYEPVSGDLVANTPYIFVPAGTSVSLSSVAVRGNDAFKASDSEGVMWGTYERIDWDGSQTDVFGFAASPSTADNIAAGEFVRIGSGSWTLPFRAYIRTSLPSTSRLRLVIDGEHQTGISVIAGDGMPASGWFSLDGRRLVGQPTVPGLYINNGVKVMVK